MSDFRLYGLQKLLVYKSQPPGLRDLLLHKERFVTGGSRTWSDRSETESMEQHLES